MILESDIEKAVAILRAGGLVAFPTETVYGLGADATNPLALKKIFQAKGRPEDHPLIVHLADAGQLSQWAREIPAAAYQLAAAFWPGPLTLILKKAPEVSDLLTGHQDTIGLRVPHHPVAQQLLQAFGSGLAAPSANRFGRISPTTAEAVREELGVSVDEVLEGGQCEVGVESTIVDVSGDAPVVLRPGMISSLQIETVLQKTVSLKKENAPRVSGSLESHYAPRTLMRLVASGDIHDFVAGLSEAELPVVVLSYSVSDIRLPDVRWIKMPLDAKGYAHDLYRVLREMDREEFRQILVESVPETVEWDAVRDRLQRASC